LELNIQTGFEMNWNWQFGHETKQSYLRISFAVFVIPKATAS